MTFYVDRDEGTDMPGVQELFDMTAEAALNYTGCPYECEIDLTLTGDEGIKELNRTYRQKDSVTDVLSFPLLTFDEPGDFSSVEERFADCFNPETGELMLGSIVLNLKRAKEQALSYGHSMKRETAFLIVHSMLHLQGFDHMTDADRAVMEKAQEEILNGLNILRKA